MEVAEAWKLRRTWERHWAQWTCRPAQPLKGFGQHSTLTSRLHDVNESEILATCHVSTNPTILLGARGLAYLCDPVCVGGGMGVPDLLGYGESGAISTGRQPGLCDDLAGTWMEAHPAGIVAQLSKLVQAGSAMTNDTVRIVPSRRARMDYLQQTTSGSCRAATATSSTARRATTRSIASVDGSQASPPGRSHLYVHHDSCASAPHLQTAAGPTPLCMRPSPPFHSTSFKRDGMHSISSGLHYPHQKSPCHTDSMHAWTTAGVHELAIACEV